MEQCDGKVWDSVVEHWNSLVEQRSSVEQCGGTLELWNSMVEYRNSVMV